MIGRDILTFADSCHREDAEHCDNFCFMRMIKHVFPDCVFLISTHRAVVDVLPLFLQPLQVLPQTSEALHLRQSADLVPGLLAEPGAGVGVRVVQPHAPRQQEAPLRLIHLRHRGWGGWFYETVTDSECWGWNMDGPWQRPGQETTLSLCNHWRAFDARICGIEILVTWLELDWVHVLHSGDRSCVWAAVAFTVTDCHIRAEPIINSFLHFSCCSTEADLTDDDLNLFHFLYKTRYGLQFLKWHLCLKRVKPV